MDFIEVEYTGRIKDGEVFDTTSESVAKKEGIHTPRAHYGAMIVCLGQGHLLKGLEEELKGKKEGKYTIELPEAFGKRDAKLLQLIPTTKLTKADIKPFPGLQIEVDGAVGTIKTVSGGRTIVDFNHPLSGKDVVYDVEIKRFVTEDKEKVQALLERELPVKAKVEEKEGKIIVHGIPEKAQEIVKKRISEFVKKEIAFEK